MVYANQEAYYNAIQASTAAANSGPFIDFMLQEILDALKIIKEVPCPRANTLKFGLKFGLNSGQIIELIRHNSSITLDEIADTLSVTRRAIEKKIKELRDAGYIRREGSNKSGCWVIIE